MPWSTLQNWSGRLRVKIRRQQASASAGWPALRWRTALRKSNSASSGSIRRPSEQAFKAAGRSPSIWWQRAIRAKSLRTMESVGGRSAQAALEMAQSGWPVLPLDGDRAVEEHERVIGPLGQLGQLGQLGLEDFAIALELAFTQRRVGDPCDYVDKRDDLIGLRTSPASARDVYLLP